MQVETTPIVTKRPAPWKTAMNVALPIVLIAVFAWQIQKNWASISHEHWDVSWGLAALAVGILIINSALETLIWNRTLGWFTAPLPFKLALPVYIWSSLARYIPGKVASLLLRVALTNEVKRDVVPVLASSTVELALRTASGLFLLLVALLGWGLQAKGSVMVMPLLVVPLVLICAHPKIMLPVMNWALRKIKQQPITQSLGYAEVLGIFLATIIRWIVYGLGFAVLGWAIYPAAIQHFPVLIGTAAGSWSAGFISMSPGGLGFAEWVQKYILQDSLAFPVGITLVLPILFRLATLLAEGLWALVALFCWRRRASA